MQAAFITAIPTPLTENEDLLVRSLEKIIADQFNYAMDGILVAGSMGAMQLLKDSTYKALIEKSLEFARGRHEVLAGAGDTGLQRTKQRIEFLNTFPLDGVAVLCPFFWKFSQKDLVDYFKSLADFSRNPLYLYDLPQVVGTKLELDTVIELAGHPNIIGGKFSCDFEFVKQLFDLNIDNFRIIISKPDLIDVTLRCGIQGQLDGIYCLVPSWCEQIKKAAKNDDGQKISQLTLEISKVRNLFVRYGFPALTPLMNGRGIDGLFAPGPFSGLPDETIENILGTDIVQKVIHENPLSSK